jgi:hypothetical protein
MSFTVDDREFTAGVTTLMHRWRLNTREGMSRYGQAAVAAMRSHIHDVSGELAGSLKVEEHFNQDPPYIEVGAFETGPNPHGLHDEYGTSKMAARPFGRPGLIEAEREFIVEP